MIKKKILYQEMFQNKTKLINISQLKDFLLLLYI